MIVFIFGQAVGRFIGFNYQDTASLNLTTLARNTPIALAIALTAFPEQPLIAIALVIGPLIAPCTWSGIPDSIIYKK